jgi:hypothetical protein
VTFGSGGSADLAKGYYIFAAKAAYCRRDAASHTRGLTPWRRKELRHYSAERTVCRSAAVGAVCNPHGVGAWVVDVSEG